MNNQDLKSRDDANMENNSVTSTPLNTILYGPPGTGKTYATIDTALEILDPTFLRIHRHDRASLKQHFDEFVRTERVRFVTFHQSFSYEDFVEGIRAVSNEEKHIEYRIEPGIFKRLCDDARTEGTNPAVGIRTNPHIWKISINGAGSSSTKSYCLDRGEARIGWGKTGDLRHSPEQNNYYKSLGAGDKGTLRYFAEEIAIGDILLCIHSADQINAIGVVTSDYRYENTVPAGIIADYQHVRSVKWLYRDLGLSILPLNDSKQFTLKTVYQMDRFTWGDLYAYLQSNNCKPLENSIVSEGKKPYVLIIDEINRGNISRIFGELITLIEPSKREDAEESLSTELPYSKKPFSVPGNVYLIGTMNTADRSLAGLDIALRRRFTFREMPPMAELLDDVEIEGINIADLLRVMNQRIEVLIGRDYCIGHAYFMPLQKTPNLETLAAIFKQKVLPLLQEYFFEDWSKIQLVLNDHRKQQVQYRFIHKATIDSEYLFGTEIAVRPVTEHYRINPDAFKEKFSYLQVIQHNQVALPETSESAQPNHTSTLNDNPVIENYPYQNWVIRKHKMGYSVSKDGVQYDVAKKGLRDMNVAISANLDLSELNTYQCARRLIDFIRNAA